MRPLLILGTLILCLSWTLGCVTVGQDFDLEKAQSIENGRTTKEQIADLFGKPFKTGIQNGYEVWIYEQNKGKMVGEDTSKNMIIEFDKNNVVRKHSISSTEPAL